jgi:hypothetical protein
VRSQQVASLLLAGFFPTCNENFRNQSWTGPHILGSQPVVFLHQLQQIKTVFALLFRIRKGVDKLVNICVGLFGLNFCHGIKMFEVLLSVGYFAGS